MFWKKKKKQPQKPSREDILRQAKATAAAKREEIGEDTLEAIRDALMKKENSPMAQAKRRIIESDEEKVRDHLKYMLADKE